MVKQHHHYYWRDADCYLNLYVVPRTKNDRIVGIHDNRLKIQVAAPANDGKANSHLVKFLAAKFLVPLSTVKIIKGECSQYKLVKICNLQTAEEKKRVLQLIFATNNGKTEQ